MIKRWLLVSVFAVSSLAHLAQGQERGKILDGQEGHGGNGAESELVNYGSELGNIAPLWDALGAQVGVEPGTLKGSFLEAVGRTKVRAVESAHPKGRLLSQNDSGIRIHERLWDQSTRAEKLSETFQAYLSVTEKFPKQRLMSHRFIHRSTEALWLIQGLDVNGRSPVNAGKLKYLVENTPVLGLRGLMLQGKARDAINYSNPAFIFVDPEKLHELEVCAQHRLAFHEYLPLMGVADEKYQVSSQVQWCRGIDDSSPKYQPLLECESGQLKLSQPGVNLYRIAITAAKSKVLISEGRYMGFYFPISKEQVRQTLGADAVGDDVFMLSEVREWSQGLFSQGVNFLVRVPGTKGSGDFPAIVYGAINPKESMEAQSNREEFHVTCRKTWKTDPQEAERIRKDLNREPGSARRKR